jgi:hypothetical protein
VTASERRASRAGAPRVNEATRRVATALGMAYAVAGMVHGLFEVLQGNRPTGGVFIQAIGPEQLMWRHGTEDAFTLIPNFLASGIVAMAISVLIVAWCGLLLRGRHGRTGLLLLFVALTLAGGGIGHIIFYLTAWAYATRMNRPLTWWKGVLQGGVRTLLARVWLPALLASLALFLVGLVVSVFGVVPGMTDPDAILAVCWSLLLASLVLVHVTYVAAFARDMNHDAAGPAARTSST